MEMRPVFLFIFANDALNKLKLDQEWRSTEAVLQSREKDLQFNLTPSANLEDVFSKLNRYHDRVTIFHYGGHSDHEGLELVDAKLKGSNLAVLLGQESNLQLVFLNGCANKEQVKALLDRGIPAVIATSSPIADTKSIQFSKQFYEALAAGKSIHQSFETACAFVNTTAKEVVVDYRGLVLDKVSEELEWGLYVNENKKEVLDWKVEAIENENSPSITQNAEKIYNIKKIDTAHFS